TIEPYLELGLDELTEPWCGLCGNDVEMFGVAHIAAGGGVRWTDTSHAQPFGLARVTLGLMFARPRGEYTALAGERGEGHAAQFRLNAQVDIVLETVIAADGEWRFSMGFAIDPLRILPALAALEW